MKSLINGYEALLNEISDTYSRGQRKAVRSINEQLIETNWQIGRHIVEYEQNGDARAQYGKALVMTLAKDLQHRHGRGFSRSNLTRCRQFYLAYSNGATVSHKLTWSHIIELLKLEDPMERDFYLNQSTAENWSVRELVRQKKRQLFLRLASNAPIGIILARGKDELLVEYATYGMSSQLFVQEYQLYLPDRDTLRRELERALQRVSNRER